MIEIELNTQVFSIGDKVDFIENIKNDECIYGTGIIEKIANSHYVIRKDNKEKIGIRKEYVYFNGKFSEEILAQNELNMIQFELKVADKYKNLYSSAKSRNKEFNLTIQSVRNLLNAKKCYYTGIPLTAQNFSVDRIDNSKGYVIGNVCACDSGVNSFKNNLTKQQIEKILRKMKG